MHTRHLTCTLYIYCGEGTCRTLNVLIQSQQASSVINFTYVATRIEKRVEDFMHKETMVKVTGLCYLEPL